MKVRYFLLGLFVGILVSVIFLVVILNKPFHENDFSLITQTSGVENNFRNETVVTNEGKININTATVDDFISLPGIGPAKALSIVEFRNKYGPYATIEELLYVPGIGEGQLSDIRLLIFVE